MITLHEAIEISEQRKTTIMGEPEDDTIRMQYSGSVEEDKAIFSGYDIDHDELVEVVEAMTDFYYRVSANVGLKSTFKAAIADALHIGLIKGADSAH